MRFTITVLGTQLLSIELRGPEPEEQDDETGAASGGQFELGFRPSRPSWSVLPGEDLD